MMAYKKTRKTTIRSVSKKKNKRHRTASRPIKGSLKPLFNSNIDTVYSNIIHTRGTVNVEDLNFLRDGFKDTVATYFSHAAKKKSRWKPINENSKSIIEQKLLAHNNLHIQGFVGCCISFYNDEIEHVATLNMSVAECNADTKEKAIAQARENSKKLVKCRIKKVIDGINEARWTNINDDINQQYLAIPVAVEFICGYFCTILNGKLPATINKNIYDNAYQLDSRLGNYYIFDEALKKYRLKKHNTNYSSLKQECATAIIVAI